MDSTSPVITCDLPDGLWHSANVTISCTATDAESGLASPADSGFTLSTSLLAGEESSDAVTASRQVCDQAGNCAVAGPIGGNKVDKVGPTISIGSPTSAAYVLNQAVASNYACSDGGSGLYACAGAVPSGASIDTASVGARVFTVTADDAAGNVSSASVSYSVTFAPGGTCLGSQGHQVLQPINADGTSVFKQGSTVPAKFRVCDAAGRSVGTPGVVTSFRLIQTIAGTVADVDEAVYSTTPDTAFRWSPEDQLWIFNISTKSLSAQTTYVYRIGLSDGSAIDFRFGLR